MRETSNPLYWSKLIEDKCVFGDVFKEAVSSSDRVIRDVLLCGRKSLNNREFAVGAWGDSERVKLLYGNSPVFIDHDAEAGTGRRIKSLAGLVTNARLDQSGLPRGDIILSQNAAGQEFLSTFKLAKSAEKSGASLKGIGMSHVAEYLFDGLDRTKVLKVQRVHSCDLVVGPATTKTLFESSVSDPKPFNVHDALKFVDYPEYLGADWNPEKALQALDKVDGFNIEAALKLANPNYSKEFDPEQALNGLTFI